jgi:hypothetical protein
LSLPTTMQEIETMKIDDWSCADVDGDEPPRMLIAVKAAGAGPSHRRARRAFPSFQSR